MLYCTGLSILNEQKNRIISQSGKRPVIVNNGDTISMMLVHFNIWLRPSNIKMYQHQDFAFFFIEIEATKDDFLNCFCGFNFNKKNGETNWNLVQKKLFGLICIPLVHAYRDCTEMCITHFRNVWKNNYFLVNAEFEILQGFSKNQE